MPINLGDYTSPSRTAILVAECDEYHLGKDVPAPLLQLAAVAAKKGIVPRIAKLNAAARLAGAHVFYRLMARRPGNEGAVNVTRMAQALERSGGPSMVAGSPALEVVPELTPLPGDFTFTITHGAMTSFQDSGLDSLLRNTGIETVIPVGVSMNVAIIGAVIEATNRNYKCIVPTDCVAGFPEEYGDMILQHTIRGLAALTTAEQLAQTWGVDWASL